MKSLNTTIAISSNSAIPKSFLVNIHQVSHVMGNSRGYTLHFSGDIDQIPFSWLSKTL